MNTLLLVELGDYNAVSQPLEAKLLNTGRHNYICSNDSRIRKRMKAVIVLGHLIYRQYISGLSAASGQAAPTAGGSVAVRLLFLEQKPLSALGHRLIHFGFVHFPKAQSNDKESLKQSNIKRFL